jgi:SAM-dependent methyltransferase
MESDKLAELQRSYDRVADEYVQRLYDELAHKPFDREQLDRLIERVGGLGPICDLGCGPGQVARYLRDHGASACGVDLSPALVERARMLNPGITFTQGNMLGLDVPDQSWGGIAAFYSILHIPRAEVPVALEEMRRVLRPGGVVLLTFHLGEDLIHRDEWWGHPVSVDFLLFSSEEMKGYIAEAGLELLEALERDPYPEVEVQTRRAYLFARRSISAAE